MDKLIPDEFHRILVDRVSRVMEQGARKHGRGSWKDKDNPSLERRANFSSMSRHLAEYYNGVEKDIDSDMDPIDHVVTRGLMYLVRRYYEHK